MQRVLAHCILVCKTDGMSIIKPSQQYYELNSLRLSFVPLTKEHVSQWEVFFHDNPTERFLGFEGSPLNSLEKADFWINKQIERKENEEFGQLAIIEKSTGRFIGLGGIIPREINGQQEYEVTYSLLQNAWGNGFATETAVFFKDYMLANSNCTSVISIIHIENQASINVAIKNGMFISDEIVFMDMPVFVYKVAIS